MSPFARRYTMFIEKGQEELSGHMAAEAEAFKAYADMDFQLTVELLDKIIQRAPGDFKWVEERDNEWESHPGHWEARLAWVREHHADMAMPGRVSDAAFEAAATE